MKDSDCVQFLQWALPQLRLGWPGFRKVRKQVCKRIDRRCREIGLPDAAAYRAYLERHPHEWSVLDTLCHISISRFYRDRVVFDQLSQVIWPKLAEMASTRGERKLKCWSIGCASGEEPYTLNLIWRLELQANFPELQCQIVSTDVDEQLLQRAQTGCYPASSLRELPQPWREAAFRYTSEEYCLRPEFRSNIEFHHQDVRTEYPTGLFHLIFCRNSVLTYFEETLQQRVLGHIIRRLYPGGVLVIGKLEQLPDGLTNLEPWFPKLGIYQFRS